MITVALCAHRRVCSFVYVCVVGVTCTHTHIYRERERMCVRMWVFVSRESEPSLFRGCQSAWMTEALLSLQRYGKHRVYSICVAKARAQRSETHEADPVQHTSVWLKIEAQHRISEAARRWASAFMVAVWETKKRGWGLWLVELNKDCVGVRVILLSFSLSVTPHSLKTPVCTMEVNIMHSLNSNFWPLSCLDSISLMWPLNINYMAFFVIMKLDYPKKEKKKEKVI